MSNEMTTANAQQSQGEQIKNWSSWKSWNATINEHTPSTENSIGKGTRAPSGIIPANGQRYRKCN